MVAERVARRFVAEILTKQWLMGIRRGWLKLMKPNISSWRDVHQAIGKLLQFVANLRDQIKYIRQGPSRLLDSQFQGKLDKALDNLEKAIKEARSSAEHWNEVADSPDPVYRGTFKREEGEYMLTRFRDHFEETTSTSVRKRGGGGLVRDASLTEMLDKVLKLLREDAKALAEYNEANPEGKWAPEEAFTEFDLQGMKVVVDDSTLRPGQINEYVKWFLQSKKLLENRKLGKLWYGTLFIQCEKCGGENPHGKEFGVGGDYRIGPNTIRVYSRPGTGTMSLIIHELGHRYWFKFMSSEQRAKFESLISVKRTPSTDTWKRQWLDRSIGQLEQWGDLARFTKFDAKERVKGWATAFRENGEEVLDWAAKVLKYPDPSDPSFRRVIEAAKDVADFYADLSRKVLGRSTAELETRAYFNREKDPLTEFDKEQKKDAERGLPLLKKLQERMEAYENSRMTEGVPAVSDYGRSNTAEAFAEAFYHYVMGKDMTRDQLESLKSVLAARVVRRFIFLSDGGPLRCLRGHDTHQSDSTPHRAPKSLR